MTASQFEAVVTVAIAVPALVGLVFLGAWAYASTTGLVVLVAAAIVVAVLIFGCKLVTGREIDDPRPPRR